jgi:CcmD family protein
MPSSYSNRRVSNLGWLAAAFAIVWLAIGLYVVRLARAQREIARRIDAIEGKAARPPAG